MKKLSMWSGYSSTDCLYVRCELTAPHLAVYSVRCELAAPHLSAYMSDVSWLLHTWLQMCEMWADCSTPGCLYVICELAAPFPSCLYVRYVLAAPHLAVYMWYVSWLLHFLAVYMWDVSWLLHTWLLICEMWTDCSTPGCLYVRYELTALYPGYLCVRYELTAPHLAAYMRDMSRLFHSGCTVPKFKCWRWFKVI